MRYNVFFIKKCGILRIIVLSEVFFGLNKITSVNVVVIGLVFLHGLFRIFVTLGLVIVIHKNKVCLLLLTIISLIY